MPAQRRCQAADVEQGDVSLTSFHAAEIAARESAFQCQTFLREASLFPQRRQLPAEDDTWVDFLWLGLLGRHRSGNLWIRHFRVHAL